MSFFKNNSKFITAFLIGAILFSASLVYYSGKIKPEVTHPDEPVRIRMAVYFELFFIDRDFDSPQWQKVEIRLGPPVSAYITGLALWLGGQQDKIGKMGMENPWNFKENFSWNLANIKLPSREELYIVKFAMAVFVSLSVLILYWIGLKCFGMVAAICSSLFFACHPLMLECATKATLDAPLVFFIILNILLMLFFYQNLSEKKFAASLFFAAGIGLNVGIATGTKIQGAIGGVIFLVFCFCIMVSEIVRHFRKPASVDLDKAFCAKKIQVIFASMMLFSVMAAACFIAPNPCLYDRPLEGLKKMVEGRAKQINTQKMEFSTKDYFHKEYNTPLIESFPKKVRCITSRVFVGEGKRSLFFLIKLLLFLLGFSMISCDEIKYFRKNLCFSSNLIVLLWLTVIFSSVAAILYIDFITHYFTLIAPASIFMGYAIERTAKGAAQVFQRNRCALPA